jgi:hypothetical protein
LHFCWAENGYFDCNPLLVLRRHLIIFIIGQI